jgi:phosphatidylserine/phosphatidylglycerophosphate/cardiolipin synthase-like enzyme
LASSPRGVRVRSARILKNEPSSRPNEIREVFVERILAAERTIFIETPFSITRRSSRRCSGAYRPLRLQ